MRRFLLALSVVFAGLAGAGTPVLGAGWPTKPIRVIVPLTAGSASDVMARIVVDQLSQQLGQPVIVENRPGAGNTIGMARSPRPSPTATRSWSIPRPTR